jgi:hypothetical protein
MESLELMPERLMSRPVRCQARKTDVFEVRFFQGKVSLDLAREGVQRFLYDAMLGAGLENALEFPDGFEQQLILFIQEGDPAPPGNGLLAG